MACTCTHIIEDHAANGTCQEPGCPCAGYEEEDEEED